MASLWANGVGPKWLGPPLSLRETQAMLPLLILRQWHLYLRRLFQVVTLRILKETEQDRDGGKCGIEMEEKDECKMKSGRTGDSRVMRNNLM